MVGGAGFRLSRQDLDQNARLGRTHHPGPRIAGAPVVERKHHQNARIAGGQESAVAGSARIAGAHASPERTHRRSARIAGAHASPERRYRRSARIAGAHASPERTHRWSARIAGAHASLRAVRRHLACVFFSKTNLKPSETRRPGGDCGAREFGYHAASCMPAFLPA